MSQPNAIQLHQLSKLFGKGKQRVVAVKGLDLEVAAGQVFGFLGPNGAGKSSTIRMIMDLIHPSAGSVSVFGQPVRQDRAVLRRVGALVEGATFYEFLTARRNLELLGHVTGSRDPARVSQLLAQVGLADRADQPVKGYSTGMKQRLGLAAAQLHDPDLIILDEPTNGLDPGGMQQVRALIRELVDQQGKTVFLSSHLMGEVEQVCDRVAIISKGEILRQGAVADLLAAQLQLIIRAAPLPEAAAALEARWPTRLADGRLLVAAAQGDTPEIARTLVAHQIDIFEIQAQKQSLEQLFLEVTAAAEDSHA